MKLNNLGTPKAGTFVPSKYQQALFDWAADNAGTSNAAVVNAVAGSGKSKSLNELTVRVGHKYGRIASLAFNSHIAKETKQKTTVRNVDVRTYHSLGLSAIRKVYPKVKIDDNGGKVEMLVKSKLIAGNLFFLIPSIKRLVSLCKAFAINNPGDEFLYDTALNFSIELFEDRSAETKYRIFDSVRFALIRSLETADQLIDFDDMIFVPVVLGFTPDTYDLILADEFQDTNLAQAMLIEMAKAGVLVGVGDPQQSIYAFRGANSSAMDSLVEKFGAVQLPLSISYRCPMAVGNLVREQFPHIKFESPDWAIAGSVSDGDISKLLDNMQDGDIVISRVNANLPKIAFNLIRKGKTARILGRDIGRSLKALIEKMKADSVGDLFVRLKKYQDAQVSKMLQLGKTGMAGQVIDQVETITALSEGANSVYDIITRCQTMFDDEQIGISLGTIHKHKGREAKNVYVSRPDLIPLEFVMKKGTLEDKQQELNMKYVSFTRSTENLVFAYGEL